MSAKSPSSFAVIASAARSPLLHPYLRASANIPPSIPRFNERALRLRMHDR
jgi:hypothetical protein